MTFRRDCQAFVGSEWAVQGAATLGWDARKLFGCHRDRPWLLNWWGMLWFLGKDIGADGDYDPARKHPRHSAVDLQTWV